MGSLWQQNLATYLLEFSSFFTIAAPGAASLMGTVGAGDEPMSPKTSTRRLALFAGGAAGAAEVLLIPNKSAEPALPYK